MCSQAIQGLSPPGALRLYLLGPRQPAELNTGAWFLFCPGRYPQLSRPGFPAEAALRRINLFRVLAGLPPVTEDPAHACKRRPAPYEVELVDCVSEL